MTRRIFPAAFLVLVALATSGCTTMLLVDAAREPVINEYTVSHVESAWRDVDGGLNVCFFGWPTGDAESGPPQPYSMRVPPGTLQSMTVPAGTTDDARNILAWPAAFHHIEPECRALSAAGTPVAVQRLYSPPTDDEIWTQRPLHELLEPAELNLPDPVIYSLDEAEGQQLGIIVYQHDAPLAGGARFVRLDTPYEETYEYNAAIFLIPVTVVVDTVILIGYIYLCSQSAGAC